MDVVDNYYSEVAFAAPPCAQWTCPAPKRIGATAAGIGVRMKVLSLVHANVHRSPCRSTAGPWTDVLVPRSLSRWVHRLVLAPANADEWTSTLYAPYPGAPPEVPSTEDWAFDRHITRGGAFRHDRDLARCARRHGAYEPDLEAIGVGFRLAAPAA